MSWDLEVDVVAVGSGLGGVCAAIAAHDAGGKVLLLEKAPKLGGVCAYSGGEVFVGCNHLMAEAGTPDDPVAARAYQDFLAGGYASKPHADILFEQGPVIAKWFADHAGVQWKIIEDFPDYHYPKAPGTVATGRYLEPQLFDGSTLGPWQKRCYSSPHMPPGITHDELFAWGGLSAMPRWDFRTMGGRVAKDIRGMGPGMMGWFLKAALVDRQIEARVSTPVTELIREGARIVGVVAQSEGKAIRIRARKGVVIATGGYDWNQEVARSFEGLPTWNSMVQPSVSGDNLTLGADAGAALAGVPPYNLGMFFGFKVDGEKHDGAQLWRASWEGGYPHALWVDRSGKRFADESFYRDYLPKVRAWDGVKQEHPHYPPFLIFDQQYRDKYAFLAWMPGQPIPETLVQRGETARELAEKLGIDADAFEATLTRFNANAAEGVDPDFDRGTYPWAAKMTGDRAMKNPNLGTVEKAPFYGIALSPVGVGVNAVGLRWDTNAQVVSARGQPIAGLYAAGNAAALLDIGAGYQSGLSNLRGMTWGFIAGRHAMA